MGQAVSRFTPAIKLGKVLQGQRDRQRRRKGLSVEEGLRGGWEKECASTRVSTASGAPDGAGRVGGGGRRGRGQWPQPSCARAHLAGWAGGAVRGAAPGPRPFGDTRLHRPGAHSADAPTAEELSRPLHAPWVSRARGRGWRAEGSVRARGFATRAPRRGQWPGLDDGCGWAGLTEGWAALDPRASGPRGELALGSRGPGVCGP